jgi:hypothetical protein
MVIVEKVGVSKFGWRWWKEFRFFFQVIRMILDVRGLLD